MSFTTTLTERAAHILDRRSSRRGFLNRAALVGSAVATTGVTYGLRPTSAYAAVCGCSGRTCSCSDLCCDGYTEFCCQIYGSNTCPPGSIVAGWWKVDNSRFCNGAARYYMDCNKSSPNCGCGVTGVCRDDTPCQCRSCGYRKDGCTVFRYGNCNNHVSCVGPILCRIVTCSKPWEIDPACSTVARTDESTRDHHRPCLETATGERFDVLMSGNDGRVWQRYYQPGRGWESWGRLGGSVGGGVRLLERDGGAANRSTGKLDVFAVWSNGQIVHRYWRPNSGWSPWSSRGRPGSQRFRFTPGVCARHGSSRIDVFGTTEDGRLWQRYWRAGVGWSPIWGRLDGRLIGGVDAIARDDNKIDVFGIGAGGRLVQRYWRAGSGWSIWGDLGRPPGVRLEASPGACHRHGGNSIDVFAVGSDGRLYQRYWRAGSGWSIWGNLGGSLAGSVSAITRGDDKIDVFAVGRDGRLHQRYWRAGAGWSPWVQLGAPATGLVAA